MSRKKGRGKDIQRIQDLMPLETIYTNGIGREKAAGGLFAILEISPINLALLDENEEEAFLQSFHDFLQRLPWRIVLYAFDVTPDLEQFRESIKRKAREAGSPALHAMAVELAGHLHALLAGQQVRERRYYLVLVQEVQSAAESSLTALLAAFLPSAHREAEALRRRRLAGQADALLQRVRDLTRHLNRLGLATRRLKREEVLNLLRAAYDPTRPAISWGQAQRRVVASADGEERP